MTEIEALEIALTKEESSIALYKSMISRYKNISELATSLLNEEYKHKKLIQEKITELTKY